MRGIKQGSNRNRSKQKMDVKLKTTPCKDVRLEQQLGWFGSSGDCRCITAPNLNEKRDASLTCLSSHRVSLHPGSLGRKSENYVFWLWRFDRPLLLLFSLQSFISSNPVGEYCKLVLVYRMIWLFNSVLHLSDDQLMDFPFKIK